MAPRDVTGNEGTGVSGNASSASFIMPPTGLGGVTTPPYTTGFGSGISGAVGGIVDETTSELEHINNAIEITKNNLNNLKETTIEITGTGLEKYTKELEDNLTKLTQRAGELTSKLGEFKAVQKSIVTDESSKVYRHMLADLRGLETSLDRNKRKASEYANEIKKLNDLKKEQGTLTDKDAKALEGYKRVYEEINKDIKKTESAFGGLGQTIKKTAGFGKDMMSALGAPGAVTGIGGAMLSGGMWGALATGALEFAKALKSTHDEMRQLRNEASITSNLLGKSGGFGTASAGSMMGRSRVFKYETGMTEQEQMQFMSSGLRAGALGGNVGQNYNTMRQMWALGQNLGESPAQLMSYSTDLMAAGVSQAEVPQALLDLANNARAAGMGVSEYRDQVLSLNRATRMYGVTLEDSQLMVRHFAKYLQEGSMTLADLQTMVTGGVGDQMRGPRAFLAMGMAGGADWAKGIEGAGELFSGVGNDPLLASARMRRIIEEGTTAEKMTYAKGASAFTISEVAKMMGTDVGVFTRGGDEGAAALDLYSQMMKEQFGISTPKTLEGAEDFAKAIESMKTPTDLLKDAATGFLEGQEQFEENIDTMTEEALKNYQDMKSIFQNLEEMFSVMMLSFVVGINDLVSAFTGGKQGLLSPEMRAGMVTGFGKELISAGYGENAPLYAQVGAGFVLGASNVKYNPLTGGYRKSVGYDLTKGNIEQLMTMSGKERGELGVGFGKGDISGTDLSTVSDNELLALDDEMRNLRGEYNKDVLLDFIRPDKGGVWGLAARIIKDSPDNNARGKLESMIDIEKKRRGLSGGSLYVPSSGGGTGLSKALGGFIPLSAAMSSSFDLHGGETIIPPHITEKNKPQLKNMLEGGSPSGMNFNGDINIGSDMKTIEAIARAAADAVYNKIKSEAAIQARIKGNYN